MGLRDDVVPTLQGSALFNGYSRKEIAKLVEDFDEQVFQADHRIVSEGRMGMDFFIILEGEAEVVGPDGAVSAHLRAGDFFGEVAALDDGPRTASVRTVSQLRCLGLPNGTLRKFLLEHPLFTVNVMHAVVRRFRAVVTSASQTLS